MPEEVIVPKGLESCISVNTTYEKIIRNGTGCGHAKESSAKQWINHLRRHGIPSTVAHEMKQFIGELGWERFSGSRETLPPSGLAPQPGLKVIDGVRCRHCRGILLTDTNDIRIHWEMVGHEDTSGSLVELVRIQSWDGYDGRDQSSNPRKYWEVREETQFSATDKGNYGQEGADKADPLIGNFEFTENDWEEGCQGEVLAQDMIESVAMVLG